MYKNVKKMADNLTQSDVCDLELVLEDRLLETAIEQLHAATQRTLQKHVDHGSNDYKK